MVEPLIGELQKASDHLTPYVVLVGIVICTGTILVLGVLYLRPGVDPLALISSVGSLTVLGTNQALTFLKTLLQVNGKNGK